LQSINIVLDEVLLLEKRRLSHRLMEVNISDLTVENSYMITL